MIADLKFYLALGASMLLLAFLVATKAQLYSTTKEYESYKESINDQVQKNVAEKSRIESEQTAAAKSARDRYARDLRRLADELERVRRAGAVPREGTVPVAGCSGGTVPGTEADTGVTYIYLEDHAGIIQRGLR